MSEHNISAPYEAQFNPTGPSAMFAHNLPDMMRHVADVIASRDPRFKGYLRVTNGSRTLTFAEVNVLGMPHDPR